MCNGKRAYKNKGIALKATRAPRFKEVAGRPLLPYKCPEGEGWHVGHRSRGHRKIAPNTLRQMNPPDMATIEARAMAIRLRQALPPVDWEAEFKGQRERFVAYADEAAAAMFGHMDKSKKKARSFRKLVSFIRRMEIKNETN